MNNHLKAWEHVNKQIFGNVCEVTRKKPWGFKEDREDIVNMTINEFLSSDSEWDTVILHILVGEGESMDTLLSVIDKAYARCIKLIILEHNPDHGDWEGKNIRFDAGLVIDKLMNDFNERPIIDEFGRNMVIATTTLSPLHLSQLNDQYYKDNIDKVFVTPQDKGIDTKYLIYTHTSESPIGFELPKGRIWWVAGGGLCFESMKEENENIVIDSVLRQCIYWAKYFVDLESDWKFNRLYNFGYLELEEYQEQEGNPKHWRQIGIGITPDSIQHLSLQELDCEGDTVYVSTVHEDYWKHLKGKNWIIDSWTKRDKPELIR